MVVVIIIVTMKWTHFLIEEGQVNSLYSNKIEQ